MDWEPQGPLDHQVRPDHLVVPQDPPGPQGHLVLPDPRVHLALLVPRDRPDHRAIPVELLDLLAPQDLLVRKAYQEPLLVKVPPDQLVPLDHLDHRVIQEVLQALPDPRDLQGQADLLVQPRLFRDQPDLPDLPVPLDLQDPQAQPAQCLDLPVPQVLLDWGLTISPAPHQSR